MDVNETLRALRIALKDFQRADTLEAEGEAGARMAESVEALDEWLSKGRFLPADWSANRSPVGR